MITFSVTIGSIQAIVQFSSAGKADEGLSRWRP